MIADINASSAVFSTHLGDFKSSSAPCTDANVIENIGRFDSFDEPLVYTPGDNEWLDCGSSRDDRLRRLRELVFRSTGTTSRGRTTRSLASQAESGYPENARWSHATITFVTLHVVGGGDDQSRSQGRARRAATITWLRDAFRAARDAGHEGVVLLSQDSAYNADGTISSSYRDLADAVRAETLAFSGQVLWMQGDGHTFRVDQPMRDGSGDIVTRFRRVQVEGESKVSYVSLRVTPGSDQVFSITLSRRY
ncbi:hypothetical protein HC251_22515 [Iamia sp. SCSIO 61187]|uniref:hypothetical protein n=1 Tax=Iamia sp. SCSIO 61187 TaxID=2722752 RepID=UPI001C63A2B4|nr:hypothetical protein [Iamia sp. SCSIO 61187]QYG94929.1 hypothetical protein HC251_22515 [Iamia sp. SCSIO 61187]